MTWKIYEQGIVEWLMEYDGPRFHGILADPPYALISIAKRFGGGQAPAQEGSDGRYARLSKGFMGQDWDGFESYQHYQDWVAQWSTLLIKNALHPGAVCLFFGGTRTFHHLGVGLERGGFEIIDSVLIPWLHGQGFPKSHDISKGMDKAAGAERTEVTGTKPGHEDFAGRETKGDTKFKDGTDGFDRPWMHDDEARERYHQKLAPVTSDAEIWDGYGTALKPAWEPVFVCRAPRGDATFAELAKVYGTGGLNIDGSRIGNATELHASKPRAERSTFEKGFVEGTETETKNHGRWPANLALTHHEACVKVGEYETKGRVINRWKDGMLPFGGGAGQEYETVDPSREGEPSADRTYEHEGGTDFAMKPGARRGMELVDWYACVPGCPVRALDDQVGEAGGGPGRHTRGASTKIYGGGKGFTEATGEEVGFGDAGGPSRFFYTAKASRSEKDKGLEHYFWRRTSEGGWKRVEEEEWAKLPNPERARGCIHPTVKPLALLRYLANLFKPPDTVKSRLLVPFSGSGSEMIAGLQAGWSEVEGVEMEEIYTMIATDRINANIGMF